MNYVINIIQKGAKMINGNNFEALTHNGISQLYSETFQQQEFILQVIQIITIKEDTYTVFLSDGFTWVKGQFINEAKIEAIKSNLPTYSVIKFKAENIEVITGKEYSFKLKQFTIVNASKQNVIGEPVALKDFNKKKDFINFESGNMISSKKYYTLKEIKLMAPGLLSLSVFGKVVKKPDRINNVMYIMIQDEENQQIQCCFFGDSVSKYKDFIKLHEWYYFQDPTLQVNNKIGNMLELKINNLSNVIKQKRNSEVKPGIINHNNNKDGTSNFKQDTNKSKEDRFPLKEFIIKDYRGQPNVEQYDKYIIARPQHLFVMKNNMGRRFQCVDTSGESVEILLWNDCTFEIQLHQTYRFNYMKAKGFNDKITLQSQKNQTQILPSNIKIISRAEQYEGNNNGVNKLEKYRKRYLGSSDIVYSISEMREKCQNSKQKSIIIISCGYLTIKFDFMGSNSFDGYSQLRKRLFYVHCEKCESNEYLRSKIQLENMNGKVVCNGCKSQTIRILWNIKAILMDSSTEVPCKINSQIAEKLIQMTPVEGMLLYLGNHEALKSMIQKKLNFKRGVFKFNSKYNDRREGERFYNICEYYEDGDKIFAERSVNQLKRTLAAFEKLEGQTNPEKVNTDSPNSSIVEQNPETKRNDQNLKSNDNPQAPQIMEAQR